MDAIDDWVEPTSFQEHHKLIFETQKFDSTHGLARFKLVKAAVQKDTRTHQCYRIYGVDVDADILHTAKFDLATENFRKDQGFTDDEASYDFRLFWRVLMRHYAFGHAIRLEPVLIKREGLGLLLWRFLSAYLVPRLAAAVSLGFFSQMGAGDLTKMLGLIASKGEPAVWWVFLGVAAASFFIVMTDVQRRIGRRWGAIIVRSTGLTVLSGVYGGIGYCLNYALAKWLDECWDWKYKALCAAVAILLAHLLQLFWQDRSIGEPL